jgi:hypothetical protein
MIKETSRNRDTINGLAGGSHVDEEEVLIGGGAVRKEICGEKSKMDEKSHLLYHKRYPQPMGTNTQQP